ncbi:mechanosensitive ion channel family protein [Erwinia oleae]|uniref:mechanosensitive ion channel family protein n=1 Tax=Erwinia oleae TaxID=796334 RepID=UPI00068E271B|nr:mechanosensitive ion channel family protein [Erwinia oleae]
MKNWLNEQNLSFLLNRTLWIDTAIVIGGTLIIYWLLRSLIRFISNRSIKSGHHRSQLFYNSAIEILRSTSQLLLLVFSFLIAIKFITLPRDWSTAASHGWFITLLLQIALWVDCSIRLWLSNMRRDPTHLRNPVTTVILGIMVRVVVWAMLLLAILSNMGINITALVASLGVGGIAIALAIQTVLSDVFASLAIGFDKPFEHGDFIVFGDIAGSIEHIGLKTTRLRSLSGEQIVCSNTILLQQTIHNYKRMQERRIVFKFGISYETPAKKVRQVSQALREIIEGIEKTRFDRGHFFAFEQNQLTFEVVYYVTVADYNQYMDVQQEINLQLMERLSALGVRYAFPTRRVEFTGGTLPQVNVAGLASNEVEDEEDEKESSSPSRGAF